MIATRGSAATAMFTGTILLGAALASAEAPKAGIVTALHGSATIARATLPASAPLRLRDDVFVKDRIVTADDSLARILLGGKAVVTVRERSVVTITETPGKSTVDIAIGKVAVAVAKERMKPGERVEIRSPNAVAAIRGTVVITEVERVTGQPGDPDSTYSSRWTVPRGVIDLVPLDGRQTGPAVVLSAGQQVSVTGRQASPVTSLAPEAVEHLAGSFKTRVLEAPKSAAVPAVRQAQQATIELSASLVRALKENGSAAGADRGNGAEKSERGGGPEKAERAAGPAKADRGPAAVKIEKITGSDSGGGLGLEKAALGSIDRRSTPVAGDLKSPGGSFHQNKVSDLLDPRGHVSTSNGNSAGNSNGNGHGNNNGNGHGNNNGNGHGNKKN